MLKYFLDANKMGNKKFLKLAVAGLLIIVISVVLGEAVKYGFQKHPELVALGFISFAVTSVVIILLLAIHGLMTGHQLRKHHPNLWENSKSSSRSTKAEAIRQIKFLNDPRLKKISSCTSKIGIFCFLIWLILFSVVLSIVLITGDDSFVSAIFGK